MNTISGVVCPHPHGHAVTLAPAIKNINCNQISGLSDPSRREQVTSASLCKQFFLIRKSRLIPFDAPNDPTSFLLELG